MRRSRSSKSAASTISATDWPAALTTALDRPGQRASHNDHQCQLKAETKDPDIMRGQYGMTIHSCKIPTSSFHPAIHPSEFRTPLLATKRFSERACKTQ